MKERTIYLVEYKVDGIVRILYVEYLINLSRLVEAFWKAGVEVEMIQAKIIHGLKFWRR